MNDFFAVLVGVVLGQILTSILKYSKSVLRDQKRSKRNKLRKVARNTSANSKWLLSYYKKNGTYDDLYSCKIGEFEKKIAFLTKKEWCVNQAVDLKNGSSQHLIILADGVNDFDIDNNVIKDREASGVVMFPDGPAVYLDRIECDSKEGLLEFHVKECTYYQAYSNISKLEDETFNVVAKGGAKQDTPFRNHYISSVTDASHLKTKPFGLGGSVLLALKSESSFELLIHKRSSDIGTYPNARAVVPNFGMEPIANNVCQRTKGNQILLYNFLKEYLEELFNFEELINQASNKKVNPFWFYDNSKEAKNVLSAIDKGTIEFIFLGFGFDCLNGVPIMSFLALVNDDEVINDIKTKAELNWEGKQIDFVNLGNKIHLLEEWLKDNQYHPGAAFTISRAQAFLGKHM